MSEETTPKREPLKLWVLKVQSQHRLRLSREAAEYVTWLRTTKGFSIKCVGRVGPSGQLQIIPKEREELVLQKSRSSLQVVPASANEISAPWLEIARFSAAGWEIICSFESENGRFTFVLPEGPRDLGIVPSEGGVVAVFGTGEILEIWPAHKWIQYVSNVSANLKQLTKIALDALESRGED